MHKRALGVLGVVAFAGLALPFGLPTGVAAAGPSYTSLVFAPLPIEQPGTLAAGGTVTMCVQPQSGGQHVDVGATVFLSIDSGLFTAPPAAGGSATSGGTSLTSTPAAFTTIASCSFANAEQSGTVMDAVPITYTGPNPVPINGRDVIVAADSASDVTSGQCNGAGVCNTGTYVFSSVDAYVFSASPIAPTASLAAGQPVLFDVTAMDSTSNPVPGAFIDLSLTNSSASNAIANAFNHFSGFSNEKVNNLPTRFGADNQGQVQVTYTAASPLASGDIDTITAQNHPTATVSNTTTYTYAGTVTTTSAPYTAVTPVRVCDTRPAGGGIPSNQCNGAGQGPITQNATRNVLVTGGGVPSNATAIVVNLTAIAPTKGTFVTLFPTGGSKPNTSNVNPPAGKVVANLVEVAIGSGGDISVYNNLGTINIALDVEGYVAPASTGLFNPATPARICDTRAAGSGIAVNQCNSTGTNPIGAGGVLTFNVHSSGSPVPSSGVSAVVFNLTAIGPSKSTVLTAYPGGVTRPNASNVNLSAGATVPNRVIVAVPSSCSGTCTVNIWNSVGTVNVAIDIDGWFSAGGGSEFTGLTPARLCNTQTGVGVSGCQNGGIAAGHTMSILVDGADGIPPTTAAHPPTALVINVTAVNASAPTFATVWGPSSATRPNASDLNVPSFLPVTNLVVVEVGADGFINLFNDLGSMNFIVDVLGYYSN